MIDHMTMSYDSDFSMVTYKLWYYECDEGHHTNSVYFFNLYFLQIWHLCISQVTCAMSGCV